MPWYKMVKYFDEEKKQLMNVEGRDILMFSEMDADGHPNMVAAVCPIDAMDQASMTKVGETIKAATNKNVLILGDNIGLFKIEPVPNSEAKDIITKQHGKDTFKKIMGGGGPEASAIDVN